MIQTADTILCDYVSRTFKETTMFARLESGFDRVKWQADKPLADPGHATTHQSVAQLGRIVHSECVCKHFSRLQQLYIHYEAKVPDHCGRGHPHEGGLESKGAGMGVLRGSERTSAEEFKHKIR
jgi:hypothetical protein